MDPTTLLVVALFLLGVVAIFFLLRHQFRLQKEISQLREDQAAASVRLENAAVVARDLENARASIERLQADNAALQTEHGKLQIQLQKDAEAAEQQIKVLKQSEERLTREFENLANRIFDEKRQRFHKESREGVENLLRPVREQLAEFKKKVEDVYVQEAKDRTSLHAEIKNLRSLSERLSDDAVNLTNALKGKSKVRGNWGEMQLERILEDSGLARGREYETQASFKDEEGHRLQPDVIVHLPERKDVVIDSKVSLVAYERYIAAKNDEDRQQAIREHIASIRVHINSLSGKDYDELLGVNSLDLVIMFVPIEPAFLLALENDPDLQNEAFSKRILLVSPTTLMGTLRIIYNIWRYEYQNRNALEIARQAGGMHDQFVLFVESLEDVGKQIGKANESYETARKRLVAGRGNLVGRIERLQELGAKAKKKLSVQILEAAGEGDQDSIDDDIDDENESDETENLTRLSRLSDSDR